MILYSAETETGTHLFAVFGAGGPRRLSKRPALGV